MTRQERILQLPFFENKRELAEQVLKMEREEHVYLPDQFEIKQVPRIHLLKRKRLLVVFMSFISSVLVMMAHGSINCLRTR